MLEEVAAEKAGKRPSGKANYRTVEEEEEEDSVVFMDKEAQGAPFAWAEPDCNAGLAMEACLARA